jgi:hypothetical protein
MNQPPLPERPNREFDLALHVVEHGRAGQEPRYTVGVWDRTPATLFLRALCHARPIGAAVLAIMREVAPHDESNGGVSEYPQWSRTSDLVLRLQSNADADSRAAAEEIEDLSARLHNAIAKLQEAMERLTRLGALVEEVAAKAHAAANDSNYCRRVTVPEDLWLKLLANYRGKEEGCAVYHELQMLRELAGITADTLVTVENWLGSAGTREGAMDSLWRLARILKGMGYALPLDNLQWRGQLARALDDAGLGLGSDNTIRIRQPQDRYWGAATGPAVKTILQGTVAESRNGSSTHAR